jgi:uncharacterized protein (DUF427 family)
LNIGAFIPDYRLLLTIGDATGSGFQHQRIGGRFADSLARKCLYRAPEARCKPPFSTQTGINGKKIRSSIFSATTLDFLFRQPDCPMQALGLSVSFAHTGFIAMKIPGPDHPITISPLKGRVTVQFKGVQVAQSDKALELKEAQYPAVIYVPRSDISIEHYVRTEHRTHCPYKGDASYFSLTADGQSAENAVWTYEEAYPSVKEIEGHVAFYPDKVTLKVH